MPCNVLHANGRLYPKGYIASNYNTLLSTNVITKTSISSADVGILQTISPSSIIQSATITSPNIAFVEISKNILHIKGCLYPKGYTEQRFDNIFFSKDILSSSVADSPEIEFHHIFYADNFTAQAKTENPHIAFKFIAYANKLNEKTQTTITNLYTNPVYLELTGLKAQQKINSSTDLYPNWYKPHRNQIGTGVYFKQGNKTHTDITAANKTPNRRDKKHIESWQDADTLNRQNSAVWVEKRRIDAETKTPFSIFTARGRTFNLNNIIPIALDCNLLCEIDILFAFNNSNLFIAKQPQAKDINWHCFIDELNELNVKKGLLISISIPADRINFKIVWGVGGIGCKHRYIPPLGNTILLEFKTGLKVVV